MLDFPAQSRIETQTFSTEVMVCSLPDVWVEIRRAQVLAQVTVRRLSSALSGPAELAKQV